MNRGHPHRQVWHSSVPAPGVKASGGSVRGESCSFTPAPGNPAVRDGHVERKMQLTLTPASTWRLSYHHRWLYWELYTHSCPLPLPLLRTGPCTSVNHHARQSSVRPSVHGARSGYCPPTDAISGVPLLTVPWGRSAPGSAPSLSPASHPAPLLAPQHEGEVNHDPVPALTPGWQDFRNV